MVIIVIFIYIYIYCRIASVAPRNRAAINGKGSSPINTPPIPPPLRYVYHKNVRVYIYIYVCIRSGGYSFEFVCVTWTTVAVNARGAVFVLLMRDDVGVVGQITRERDHLRTSVDDHGFIIHCKHGAFYYYRRHSDISCATPCSCA